MKKLVKATADHIGCSKSTVSLVLANKRNQDTKLGKKIIAVHAELQQFEAQKSKQLTTRINKVLAR